MGTHGGDGIQKLIGVNGHWYDITQFIPHHPGGDVIKQFVGKDATAVFNAFHRHSVLKHRKPCAKMERNSAENDPISTSFAQLRQRFESEGYFDVDYYWYSLKFLVTFVLFLTCITFVSAFPNSSYKYLGAVALAAFWQQCGFFMHDFEHNQFTHNRHKDKWLGLIVGNLCLGISSSWWREEHYIHHALTTCVDYESKFADPQMMQDVVWAQNEKLWPFYKSKIAYFCVKVQHITFIPVCVIMGRVNILIVSMVNERRLTGMFALLLHWMWVFLLMSMLPNIKEAAIFYSIASVLQGVLHIQLLISHYAKDFHNVKDIATNVSWSQMQVESNIDIITPWWLDWFHGGLNYHLVHHLYPRMPRHNFRKATKHVQALCKDHGFHYDHCGWLEAIVRTLKQLKLMSVHFTLDPR